MSAHLAGPLDREALRGLTRSERLRVLAERRRIRNRAAANRSAAARAYGEYLAAVEADTPAASVGLREVTASRRKRAAADLAAYASAGYGDRSRWPAHYRRVCQ